MRLFHKSGELCIGNVRTMYIVPPGLYKLWIPAIPALKNMENMKNKEKTENIDQMT